jgi:serine/threonine-protein kinase
VIEPIGDPAALTPPDAAPPEPVVIALPDAAPALASLGVITTPAGAVVELDGEPRGEISPVHFQQLEPGEHMVVVTLDGYEDAERTVTLAGGELRTLDMQLVAIPEPVIAKKKQRQRPSGSGRVTVRTEPWAHVYFKGDKIGTTPFANVKLPAGTHTLVFKNPSKKTVRRKVVVRSGKTTKLNFALR